MSPDRRKHRGAHPADHVLFGGDVRLVLRAAVEDISWLLSRGYALEAAQSVVCGHYRLAERQRNAVVRAACSDFSRMHRRRSEIEAGRLRFDAVSIDALNVLITLEAALSGGVLLRCRDGCVRDLSGVHGTYRMVSETPEAIRLAAESLDRIGVVEVAWIVDRLVSNSGRLAERLRAAGEKSPVPWQVLCLEKPDEYLAATNTIPATADSRILDRVDRWFDLVSLILPIGVPGAWVVDLSAGIEAGRP